MNLLNKCIVADCFLGNMFQIEIDIFVNMGYKIDKNKPKAFISVHSPAQRSKYVFLVVNFKNDTKSSYCVTDKGFLVLTSDVLSDVEIF